MADPEPNTPSERAVPPEPTAGAKKPGARLGRRIAATIVVSGIAYLIIMGLVSVVPQVFYPETAEIPDDLTCSDGVNGLREELLTHAGERITAGGDANPTALRTWLHAWDARYHAIESRCEGSELERWTLVGRLRHRIQGMLERYDSAEGELARATHRASST